MPTPLNVRLAQYHQGSSYETYTLTPLVVNAVANRYQRGYTTSFPHYGSQSLTSDQLQPPLDKPNLSLMAWKTPQAPLGVVM